MKHFGKTAITLLFTLHLAAQDFAPQVRVASAQKNLSPYYMNFAGSDTSGYYCFGLLGGFFNAMKLDDTLNLKKSWRLGPDVSIANADPHRVFVFAKMIGNRLLLFSEDRNKRKRQYVLCAQEVDKNTLQLSSSIDTICVRQFDRRSEVKNFPGAAHAFSPDGKKVLLYYPVSNDASGNLRWQLKVVDENMKTVWEKIFYTYLPPDNLSLVKAELDNRGSAYLLATEKISLNGRTKKNLRWHLFVCRDKGFYVKDVLLSLDTKYMDEVSFDAAENGNVNVAGLYTSDGISHLEGTFCMVLSSINYTPLANVLNPFSPELLRHFNGAEDTLDDFTDPLFSVRDVHACGDGGVTMLVEREWTNTSYESNGAPSTATFALDVIAFHFSEYGFLQWESLIPKYQETSSVLTGALSFAWMFSGDSVFLLYNDLLFDSNLSDDMRPVSIQYQSFPVLTAARIDPDGVISTAVLNVHSTWSPVFAPASCMRLDNSNMLIMVTEAFRAHWGIVSFR